MAKDTPGAAARGPTAKPPDRWYAPRLTARARLTLLYGTMFLAVGVVLVGLNYGMVHERLRSHAAPDRAVELPRLPTVSSSSVPAKGGAAAVMRKLAAASLNGDPVMLRFEASTKAAAARQAEQQVLELSLAALAVSTVVAGGLGWLTAGRVLRPVHRIARTARQVSQRNLHERIDVSGPRDEMRDLAETINGMIGRLEAAFSAQQHFVANASHELRTPMTTLRAMVQVGAQAQDAGLRLSAMAPRMVEVLRRQEQILDGLFELARSEHGMVRCAEVDLARIAQSAARQVRAEADGQSVRLELRLAPCVVPGDPTLLELLVGNLLRNAVRHNEPGGQVWLRTGRGRLSVVNTGPPLTAERLAELAEPFRRGNQDRVRGRSGRGNAPARGFGLGLPIVHAVVRAHQGARLELTPREGGGLRALVELPAPAPPSAGPGTVERRRPGGSHR